MNKYVGNRYTFLPFQTPLFDKIYQDVLFTERYIRQYLKRSSHDHLYQQFFEDHFQETLQKEDYLYIVLDWICHLLERDESYVYQFDILVDDILQDFDKYLRKDFSIHLQGNLQILEHMNNKGIVGVILHFLIYPEHDQIGIEKLMTLFDKQYVMAQFVKCLYIEKQGSL